MTINSIGRYPSKEKGSNDLNQMVLLGRREDGQDNWRPYYYVIHYNTTRRKGVALEFTGEEFPLAPFSHLRTRPVKS